MKGIVFNLLEMLVTRAHGAAMWDQLLDAAGLDGAYTSIGSYPDEHLGRLVAAASHATGTPPAEIVRWFGREAFPLLAGRYPPLLAPHGDTRSLLLSLNDIIHPEVRKLYPGAETPEFRFEDRPGDVLVMEYHSARRLCAFAEGLIEGAAAHFGQAVEMRHLQCMHDGHPHCRLELVFRSAVAAA